MKCVFAATWCRSENQVRITALTQGGYYCLLGMAELLLFGQCLGLINLKDDR
jgi:hypothetical protein